MHQLAFILCNHELREQASTQYWCAYPTRNKRKAARNQSLRHGLGVLENLTLIRNKHVALRLRMPSILTSYTCHTDRWSAPSQLYYLLHECTYMTIVVASTSLYITHCDTAMHVVFQGHLSSIKSHMIEGVRKVRAQSLTGRRIRTVNNSTCIHYDIV